MSSVEYVNEFLDLFHTLSAGSGGLFVGDAEHSFYFFTIGFLLQNGHNYQLLCF